MQAQATDGPVVLPRPNLPPEPWTDATDTRWLLLAAAIIALLLVLLIIRRDKRRPKKPATTTVVIEAAEPRPEVPVDIPADRVRQALVDVFGPAWRARTTEEVASSPLLAERFGAEVTQQIVAYLRAVDRAKFSGDASRPSQELDWWASRFVEEASGRLRDNGPQAETAE